MNKTVKYEIPDGTQPSHCKGCGAVIYWIKPRHETNMPLDPDGTCHFATCPDAKRFRKAYHPDRDPRRPEQVRAYAHLMERIHKMTNWEQNFLRAVGHKFVRKKELTKHEASILTKLMETH